MSNEVIPFNTTTEVPAHLLALFGDDSNIAPRHTIDMLAYKGKTFSTVIEGERKDLVRKDTDSGEMVPVQVISLVVLDHNKGRSRAFYEGEWVDGANKAPRCASHDGVKPDASIKDPCAATCASCPNAVKGSKMTENNVATTACSSNKRVVVVPPGAQIGKHPPMLLKLAQTSVWDKNNSENEQKGWFAWDQFVDMLRARNVKHTAAVVTKVKFDTRVAYPKLLFSATGWLSLEEAQAAKAVLATKADAIAKILQGEGSDGVAGQPGIPADGVAATTKPAATAEEIAVNTAAAAAATAAAAASAQEAAEKERKAVARKQKAQAAAEAATAAAAAAASAAAAAAEADEDEGGGWGAPDTAVATAPVKAAATAKAATLVADEVVDAAAAASGATVVSGTPDGLKSLLDNWDDNE